MKLILRVSEETIIHHRSNIRRRSNIHLNDPQSLIRHKISNTITSKIMSIKTESITITTSNINILISLASDHIRSVQPVKINNTRTRIISHRSATDLDKTLNIITGARKILTRINMNSNKIRGYVSLVQPLDKTATRRISIDSDAGRMMPRRPRTSIINSHITILSLNIIVISSVLREIKREIKDRRRTCQSCRNNRIPTSIRIRSSTQSIHVLDNIRLVILKQPISTKLSIGIRPRAMIIKILQHRRSLINKQDTIA